LKKKQGQKRPNSSQGTSLLGSTNQPVDLSAIEAFQKRGKRTAEEKMASVEQGRKDREPYGARAKRQKKGGGTTNEQKQKTTKPFMLVKFKNSIRSKKKRSERQQQRIKHKHTARSKKK
jgi:protein SDA1